MTSFYPSNRLPSPRARRTKRRPCPFLQGPSFAPRASFAATSRPLIRAPCSLLPVRGLCFRAHSCHLNFSLALESVVEKITPGADIPSLFVNPTFPFLFSEAMLPGTESPFPDPPGPSVSYSSMGFSPTVPGIDIGNYLIGVHFLLFQYYAVSADYTQSAQYCSQEKATLPVIINDDENTFLAKLARHNSPLIEANPWIGLWCTGSTPSSCTWADGTPARYTNFDSGKLCFHLW